MTPHRTILLGCGLVGLMLVTTVAATLVARDARDAHDRAQAALRESAALAAEIVRFRDRPTQARREGMEPATLTRLLEEAAGDSGMSRGQLERIWPQPPQRVGDSDYQRHAARIIVRDVTLPQTVRFLQQVTASTASLNADALRLIAPRTPTAGSSTGNSSSRGDTSAETWTLEVSFSYLVYDPIDGSRYSAGAAAASSTRSTP